VDKSDDRENDYVPQFRTASCCVQTTDQNGLRRKPRSDLLDSEDEEFFFFSDIFKDSNNIKISYEDYIKQRN
jgi:hypothetical protein